MKPEYGSRAVKAAQRAFIRELRLSVPDLKKQGHSGSYYRAAGHTFGIGEPIQGQIRLYIDCFTAILPRTWSTRVAMKQRIEITCAAGEIWKLVPLVANALLDRIEAKNTVYERSDRALVLAAKQPIDDGEDCGVVFLARCYSQFSIKW